ncbi:hypothetical protein [Clostridium botulinum]|uniref:hypothetical protein n=1 Tax=Clostridium botulinum TaxID=1491 RepID=UPI0002F34CA5|nr:hypothetical protein [Clostridium botulinum]APC82220.1 hypothetical protein NPD12_3761 [Clostridium botulinum]MBY6773611.1 hypothetical protein [Clostridium botulinum]MBY6850354.1 hypothetical protein [Clostridium botulinum]MBY6857414.1 hypothetical protein [Clostridium botulinum]MBY6886069.1 hypothetical protein [Clostridium botulinum]
MRIICINNKATIPKLELKKEYEIIKETDRSYYIDNGVGIWPYAKIRFLKII